MTSGDTQGRDTWSVSSSATATTGIDTLIARISGGAWLWFLTPRLREPVARAVLQMIVAAIVLWVLAPFVDRRGEAWIESTFARTLAALAAITIWLCRERGERHTAPPGNVDNRGSHDFVSSSGLNFCSNHPMPSMPPSATAKTRKPEA